MVAPATPPMIALDSVGASYDQGRTFAVRHVRLEVAPGELLVLLGESGCGKTTTLKLINRLVEPAEGDIRIAGRSVFAQDPVALRRRIGYVIQNVGLFPHMSVRDNISLVPRLLRWPPADVLERVDELLELVGLPPAEYADRAPAALSGGQKQRIGVARALAARPDVMLMDEPFGSLDPLTRAELQEYFRGVQRRLGLTVVLVTHDMTEALLLADRIAVMRNGLIVACDAPGRLLNSPGDDYVRRLMHMPKRQADEVERLAGGGAAS